MKTVGRIAMVALVLGALAPVSASGQEEGAATGGTRVSVDGSVATITVTIDMMYGGLGTEEVADGAQEAANDLAAGLEDYWNQGFERYASDCLELRMDVVITVLPNSFPPLRIIDVGEDRDVAFATEPGHHVVFYAEGDAYGNVPPPETYDPYDDDGVAPPGEDYGSPFTNDLWAIWSPDLEDSRDFAHEFGHLLGLGDDQDVNGALPGRDGTLMADGDLIDANLVNRLTDLARDANDEVPECEMWEGTYTGTVTFDCGAGRQQTGTLESAFTITVAGGVATMDITHTVTGSCAGPNVGTLTTPITATGERTPTGFEFASFGALFGGSGVLTIPVSGDRGTGTIVITDLPPGIAMVELAVEITRA